MQRIPTRGRKTIEEEGEEVSFNYFKKRERERERANKIDVQRSENAQAAFASLPLSFSASFYASQVIN